MKKFLYIGSCSVGSTSCMRLQVLKQLLPDFHFNHIDIDSSFATTAHIWNSLGWRFKVGPLIKRINRSIQNGVNEYYDVIWIDKAFLIKSGTVKFLRNNTASLIHFTPDPAFTYHRAKAFFNTIDLYDACITTKSYEIEHYEKAGALKVVYCTQGYDPNIHFPYHHFEEKEGMAFIGHYEKERSEIIQSLIDEGIQVKLAGINWKAFAKKNRNNKFLEYLGPGMYGVEYTKVISSAKIGLGLLSKWIPEKHTTRTFEIPACCTALLTERNYETSNYFAENDVIFFDDIYDLVRKAKYLLNNDSLLKQITINGYNRAVKDGYDYKSILGRVINELSVF